ncbi:MAG: hypothetical protein IH859_03550 [Chloroflexi bacterium]|nr:hypothetical protein [Chloroflexota bacterium]
MELEEIVDVVLKSIETIQSLSGDPMAEMSRDVHPLDSLAGFDSMRCIEVMCEVERLLGKELSKTDNFFLSEDSTKSLSILQSSARMQKCL